MIEESLNCLYKLSDDLRPSGFSSPESEKNKENQELNENPKNPEQDEEQREHEFWHTPCSFTPESRLEAHRHLEEKRRAKEK